MAEDNNNNKKKMKVAVIGGGCAGLAAAWHLHVNKGKEEDNVEVHLMESSDRLGGHAHTVKVDGTTDVDIGFMVYNHENYPNCVQWFRSLGIAEQDSDMSLSVSLDEGGTVEWSSDGLWGLFANASQVLSPSFYSFLFDMIRFHGSAGSLLRYAEDDPRKAVTVEQYLSAHGYSKAFACYYLLPMMAALWRASMEDVLQFPAEQLIGFLCNHKMLQVFDRPSWKTVKGRSRQYTERLQNDILGPSVVHTSCTVYSVERLDSNGGKYKITLPPQKRTHHDLEEADYHRIDHEGNDEESLKQKTKELIESLEFDHVIFACQPRFAKAMLERGNMQKQGLQEQEEQKQGQEQQEQQSSSPVLVCQKDLLDLLDSIAYANNVLYVHSDASLMPSRKSAWASWNCMGRLSRLEQTITRARRSSNKSKKKEEQQSNEQTKVHFDHHLLKDDDEDDNDRLLQHLEGVDGRMKAVYVTYWLNRLQTLDDTHRNVFVSLNPHHKPNPSQTHHRLFMAHPQFTTRTVEARDEINRTWQGRSNLWFCGAWQGYGFHEDGVRSGFQVAAAISKTPLPWITSTCTTTSTSASASATSPRGAITASSPTAALSPKSSPPVMVLPPPDLSQHHQPPTSIMWWASPTRVLYSIYRALTYHVPVAICKPCIHAFLRKAVRRGTLRLKLNDGTFITFGDGSPGVSRADDHPVTIRVLDDWFFVLCATQYDLGLARSYMQGYCVVEPLPNRGDYHPSLLGTSTTCGTAAIDSTSGASATSTARDETTRVLGDPVGWTRLFLLLIGNRDLAPKQHVPVRASRAYLYSNALANASGLILSKIGSLFHFVRYKLCMDNSERGGSWRNIHSHYDISNDLFTSFLDPETLVYSSAIYDTQQPAAAAASTTSATGGNPTLDSKHGLIFGGTLEQAQWRKLDTLCQRAQLQPGQKLLDIGFGWGGLAIYAAKHYGVHVTGITLSVEQKNLALQRVRQEGLEHAIDFYVVDYRTFCRQQKHWGLFDRVISCEMIEAVGHNHLEEFFWAVEQVLKVDGVFVMEAITTPEQRYETYKRSADFINTIIFPGSCCPSLHALVDAAYRGSRLSLEHIDNIGLHYAQTLAEWRRRFNANEAHVRSLGFDDVFLRAWNYYFTYCEAGFFSQTENCLILVFARPGCKALIPLSQTLAVTPHNNTAISGVPRLSNEHVQDMVRDAKS